MASTPRTIALGNLQVLSKFGVATTCKKQLLSSDGIMGLDNLKTTDNIFDLAYRAGKIRSSKFALQIPAKGSAHLYFDIGPRDFTDAVYESSINEGWSIIASELSFGSLILYNSQVVFDSGSDGIYFSPTFFAKFKEKYFRHCHREMPAETYLCRCDNLSAYPNITIETPKIRLVLSPSVYLKQSKGNFCELDALPLGINYVLMGQQFFSVYSIIFDKANQKLGFFKSNAQAEQKQPVEDNQVRPQAEQYFQKASIYAMVFIAIALLLSLLFLILQVIRTDRNKNLRIEMTIDNYINNLGSVSNGQRQLQQITSLPHQQNT